MWYWCSFIEFWTSHVQRWNLHSIIGSVCVCVWVCARFKERTSVGVCVCLNLSGRFACSVDYMSVHISSSTPKCMTRFHPSVRLFPLLSFAYVDSHWMWAHFGIYLCTCRRKHIRLSPDLPQPIHKLIVKLHHTVLNARIEFGINRVSPIGLFHATDLSVFLICLTSQSGLPKLHIKLRSYVFSTLQSTGPNRFVCL